MTSDTILRHPIIAGAVASLIAAGIAAAASAIITTHVLEAEFNDLKSESQSSESNLTHNINMLTATIKNTQNQFNDLEKKYDLIAGFLQAKYKFNVAAFIDTASKKSITPKQLGDSLDLFEKSSPDVDTYLEKNLNFTPTEVKAVMTAPENKAINKNIYDYHTDLKVAPQY